MFRHYLPVFLDGFVRGSQLEKEALDKIFKEGAAKFNINLSQSIDYALYIFALGKSLAYLLITLSIVLALILNFKGYGLKAWVLPFMPYLALYFFARRLTRRYNKNVFKN